MRKTSTTSAPYAAIYPNGQIYIPYNVWPLGKHKAGTVALDYDHSSHTVRIKLQCDPEDSNARRFIPHRSGGRVSAGGFLVQNNIFHRTTQRYRLCYDKDEGILKFSLDTSKNLSRKEIQEHEVSVDDPTQNLIKAFEFDTIKESLEEILFFFASFATFLCEQITDKEAQVEILQKLRDTKDAAVKVKLQTS